MKVSILMFTLISLLFVIHGTQGATEIYSFTGPHPYDANQVHTIPLPLNVPHNVSGSLTFTLLSNLEVIFCVQEKVQLTGGLSSCNSEGYMTFNPATNPPTWMQQEQYLNNKLPYLYAEDKPRLSTNSTTLKADRDYWLSFLAPVEVTGNSTNCTVIELKVTAEKECPGNTYGPLCQESYPVLVPQGIVDDFTDGNVQYYLIPPFNYNFSQVLNFQLFPVVQNRTLHLSTALRRGAFPTRSENDLYFVNRTSFAFNISTPRPDQAGWFVAVWNLDTTNVETIETYQYNVSAYVLACNESATLHTGPNCNSEITFLDAPTYLLDNNTVNDDLTQEEDLERGELVYFEVKTNHLVLGVAAEDEDDNTPSVFVDLDFVPSAESFLMSNTEGTELVHLFDISVPSTKGSNDQWWMPSFLLGDSENPETDVRTWFIGVNATTDYVMWLNFPCANNCTDRGTCDITTGICQCDDDDYEGFDCGSKPFPLVWIILIAIGGAILLAIAIGVPVSCYIKNKRRSDYTRV